MCLLAGAEAGVLWFSASVSLVPCIIPEFSWSAWATLLWFPQSVVLIGWHVYDFKGMTQGHLIRCQCECALVFWRENSGQFLVSVALGDQWEIGTNNLVSSFESVPPVVAILIAGSIQVICLSFKRPSDTKGNSAESSWTQKSETCFISPVVSSSNILWELPATFW